MQAVQGTFLTKLNFSLSYKTYPCGGYRTVGEGYITSPGFPSKSASEFKCSWILSQPNDLPISINFTTFDLGDSCEKNFVIVYNGHVPTAPRIGKYCRNKLPENIKSQRNSLLVEYHTAEGSTVGGFNFTYEPLVQGKEFSSLN